MKTQLQQPKQEARTLQNKSKAANQAPMSQILQAYKEKTAQRQTDFDEDDDLLQGKFETAQRMDFDEDDDPLQGKFENVENIQPKEDSTFSAHPLTKNNTGLPNDLKTGVENLSGYSMDDVQVHYNSAKPAQLQALAYTQGTDIHVAPGQEKYLPHEAWHVVQQKQGRVQPTMQLQGVNINDNEGLEKEADVMGNVVENKINLKERTKYNSSCQMLQVSQLLKVGDIEYKVGDIVDFIKGDKELVHLLGNKMGRFAQILAKKDEEVTDLKVYIKLEFTNYLGTLQKSEKAKVEGDNTEELAAKAIVGQINRSKKSGKDVEWRIITREMANEYKTKLGIDNTKETDQDLFENWKQILLKETDPSKILALQKILSTPIDAFSINDLALAGGPSKFQEDNPLLLNEMAHTRTLQLLELARNLGYNPKLVFSATTTCQQCRAVAAKYSIDIIHLGARQDDLPN